MAQLTSGQFANSVEPGLRMVFANEFNSVPDSLIAPLYRIETSNKKNEDYLEVEDIGNVPQFTGNLQYTTAQEGNSKSVSNVAYALGLKIQRELSDDDLYGVIEELVRSMGEVARYRMEQDAAGPFVSAFTTTYTTFDGLSLCNSAHTYESTSTTQSNSGTSAFSYSALDATWILMRKYKNSQDRTILTMKPDMLLGPVDLASQFHEVIESKLRPGTNNNNKNAYEGAFTYKTTTFLQDTNNWFMIDSKKMKRFLLWQQRIPLEFGRDGDFDTFVKKYALYMRYANTPLSWVFVYGHNAS